MKKYFKTKHEKDSARITTVIAVILLLLVFIVGPTYLDPPEEYGIAVNFGTTSVGSGNRQPLKPIKSEPLDVNREPKVAESTPSEPVETSKAEDVLTEENEEAIALKKKKAAEAKKRAEEEAKAKAEAERIAKEKREREEKRKEVDDLFGGISKSDGESSGSEGNDNQVGDKGDINGDPYAPSYFGPGSGTGGVGFGLNGRGRPTFTSKQQDCFEYGRVVVQIEVNRQGRVIKATPGVKGTTNNAACLLQPAKEIAQSFKWSSDSNAPARQVGFVSINFSSQ